MNHLSKCRLNESEESPQNTCEEPIDTIFDHFDLHTPQVSPEVRRSGRKRKFTPPLDVNPKRRKYSLFYIFFPRKKKKTLGSGVLSDRNLRASWTLTALYYKRSNILIPEQC